MPPGKPENGSPNPKLRTHNLLTPDPRSPASPVCPVFTGCRILCSVAVNTRSAILRTIDILGVRVHECDEEDAVRTLESFLENHHADVRQVVTVNPEFIMEARRNPSFRQLLNHADLATPDGVGIVLAAKSLVGR